MKDNETTLVNFHITAYPNIFLATTVFFFHFYFFKKRLYLLIFREREREGQRERNIDLRGNTPPPGTPRAPAGDQTRNPGICSDQESNQCDLSLCGTMPRQLSHTGQGRTVL